MAAPKLDEEAIFNVGRRIEAPDVRQLYLQQMCGDNSELLVRVEALLRVHEQERQLLRTPANGHSNDIDELAVMEGPGTLIGRYKLLEKIGEGGFGVVFMAEQQAPVRRKVALKVLKPGMDTRQVVARFEVERQAVAIMDHPNIAKVHDGGATPSGRPYFVMELVKGSPITEYCDQNRLTPRARLELFGQVCAAVQHAHQKGIIHRDIKPSNVLVVSHDGTPVVKVIDFGVAKALGQEWTNNTLFTGFAQMIGTPLYMSPEQAGHSGLDVDTRTDVYALGVLLYELLTGTTPFDKDRLKEASYDEIRRIVREEEPPAPSTRMSTLNQKASSTVSTQRQTGPRELSVLLRGELDWIIMKSLEKDRKRRYETPSALAADVERYLNDEPVQACPPSRGYLLGKYLRRHRTAVLTTTTLLLAALLFGGAAAWVALERRSQQAETEQAVNLALEEADRFENAGRWKDALAAANRAVDRLGDRNGDVELRERARRRQQILALLVRLEEVRVEMAVREDNLPSTFNLSLGDKLYTDTFREFGFDVDVLTPEEIARRMPEGAIRLELAGTLDDWAWVRRRTLKEAKVADDQPWQHILAAARAADPDPDNNRLRDLWSKGTPESSKEAATVSLERLHPYSWRLALSTGRGFEMLRTLQRQRPTDFWLNFQLGLLLAADGVRDAPNKAAKAAAKMDEASGYLRAALAASPNNPSVLSQLGRSLAYWNHTHQPVEEGIALMRQAAKMKPKVEVFQSNLAIVLVRHLRYSEAADAYKNAIAASKESPTRLLANYIGLGDSLARIHRWDEAEAALDHAVNLTPNNALTEIHTKLAYVKLQKARFAESLKHYELALARMPAKDVERPVLEKRIKRVALYLDFERRLPLILAGQETVPARQLLDMAQMCQNYQKQYAHATELYQKAFAADPQIESVPPYRYDAACVAALAGCGQGTNADALSEQKRAALRNQALAWLQRELALLQAMMKKDSVKTRTAALDRLFLWRNDPDLAGIREANALQILPKNERDSWHELWSSLPKLVETEIKDALTRQESMKVHHMKLTAGENYVIDLESWKFDTVLELRDDQGTWLATNDDIDPNMSHFGQLDETEFLDKKSYLSHAFSSGLNSRLEFTPQKTGVYRFIVMSFDNDGIGDYRLVVRSMSVRPSPKDNE